MTVGVNAVTAAINIIMVAIIILALVTLVTAVVSLTMLAKAVFRYRQPRLDDSLRTVPPSAWLHRTLPDRTPSLP